MSLGCADPWWVVGFSLIAASNSSYMLTYPYLIMSHLEWIAGPIIVVLLTILSFHNNCLMGSLHETGGKRQIRTRDLISYVYGTTTSFARPARVPKNLPVTDRSIHVCSKKGRLVLEIRSCFRNSHEYYSSFELLRNCELFGSYGATCAGRRWLTTSVWMLQFMVLIVFCIGTFIIAGTSLQVHVYLSHRIVFAIQVLPCIMYLPVDQQKLVIVQCFNNYSI